MNNDYIFLYTAATLMLHETNEVMKKYLKYKGWTNWNDWLGLSKQNNSKVLPNIKYIMSSHRTEKNKDIKYLDYLKMKKIVGLLDLKSKMEWDNFFKLAENKTKVVPK